MSRAAMTAVVFGAYLIVAGLAFMIAPNVFLPLLGLPETDEIWIRVLGVVAGVLGAYYVTAARAEDLVFMRATVWGRALVFAALAGLVVFASGPAMILVFGVVDGLGALWTWSALRRPRVAA